MMDVYRTTSGLAALRDGRVTIRFGYLEGPGRTLRHIELDVDAYAVELIRDLAAALSDRETSQEN